MSWRTRPRQTLAERFWTKVDKAPGQGPRGDCWTWTGHRIKFGYGSFKVGDKVQKAHRVAYELIHGPLPEGLNALHECDVPFCVNPSHIYAGTHKDNMADRIERDRANIPKGEDNYLHKLTEKQVKEIRRDPRRNVELGPIYGVHPDTIGAVRKRKTWKHVA